MKKLFIYLVFFTSAFFLNACSEREQAEMSKGHMQAVKAQCKNDPDKKLCGKEVRQKFKRDGHEYVTFKDLEKPEINRIVINCKPERQYGLVSYNDCLYKNKQLALGNELTQQDGEARITSNVDKIKELTYHIMAFNEGDETKGLIATGTGVAIAKNYIATNCHVILDKELTESRKQYEFHDVILVENLLNEKKGGAVKLFKNGFLKDIDICILKTKSNLNYVKKRIKYSKLRQRNKVIAMGNPQGIVGHTADGKITALKKQGYRISDFNKEDVIELKDPLKIIHHDAAIGSGSSGGPLFDASGNLVGINTWILSMANDGTSGGFGMALSSDHIQDVLRD